MKTTLLYTASILSAAIVLNGCEFRFSEAGDYSRTRNAPTRSATASSDPASTGSDSDSDSPEQPTIAVDPTATADAAAADAVARRLADLLERHSAPREPVALQSEACASGAASDAVWTSASSTHFTVNYPEGSVIAEQIDSILAAREIAYASIRSALQLSAEPHLYLYLSPDRVTAITNRLGKGVAYPGYDRYDAVYSGAERSFERQRFGNLMTHLLSYYISDDGRLPPQILRRGLAEYLDQSFRDVHAEYAHALAADLENRFYPAAFDDGDLWGSNANRAASFVAHLINTFGMSGFLQLWRASAVTWQDNCLYQEGFGCIDNGAQLQAFFDGQFAALFASDWQSVAGAWRVKVGTAFAQLHNRVQGADLSAIENLLANLDLAVNSNDAARYRSVMDGFYCDWADEEERAAIAERAVHAFSASRTHLVVAYPTGVANFPTATAMVARTEAGGAVTFERLFLEETLAGWRVTWSPLWR